MKKLIVINLVVLGVIIFTASCNVNGSNTNPQQGTFLLANVSPDAPPLNISINNSPFGAGLAYGIYTRYYPVTAGAYTFSFYDSASATNPVLTNTVSISPSATYSYFVIDSFKRIKSSFVQDNFKQPGGDSVYIRFFNFSPNAGLVSLDDANSDTTFYTGRSFNDQATTSSLANFIGIKKGIYKFELRKSDSTLLASKIDTLVGGHVYSLFAKGNVDGTGTQAIGIGAMANY